MKSGKYTLDRYEGEFAVLLFREDESVQVEISKNQLESYAKEGDLLNVSFHGNGLLKYAAVLEKETKQARKKANDLLAKIVEKKSNINCR